MSEVFIDRLLDVGSIPTVSTFLVEIACGFDFGFFVGFVVSA